MRFLTAHEYDRGPLVGGSGISTRTLPHTSLARLLACTITTFRTLSHRCVRFAQRDLGMDQRDRTGSPTHAYCRRT
jgi:hypothetical protein